MYMNVLCVGSVLARLPYLVYSPRRFGAVGGYIRLVAQFRFVENKKKGSLLLWLSDGCLLYVLHEINGHTIITKLIN